MSAGLFLLRSIITAGSRASVRDLSEALFTEDERPAFRFFGNYYQRHGALPTVQIMAENGFILPGAEGPVAYFMERARDRVIYNVSNRLLTELRPAMANRSQMAEIPPMLARAQADMRATSGVNDTILIQEVMGDVMAEALEIQRRGRGGVTGVSFGWPTMDRLTAGAQGGDVISIVARPNIGKSWTMIHMAMSAWNAGHSVLFLTMEMTGLQVARRALGHGTGVNPDQIRRGQIAMYADDMLYEFIEAAADRPPFHLMMGSFRKTTADLDAVVQEFTPDIVFVDAAYLMTPQNGRNNKGSRWEKVYDLGEEIKAIAQDRARPVVQSLQLNREKKRDTEFDMSQIAGGDVIGQISSVVVAVEEGEGQHLTTRRRYTMGKNRDGELGNWQTNFLFNPVDFNEVDETDEDGMTTRQRLEAGL